MRVEKSELLKSDQDGVRLQITTPNETKTVSVIGGKGVNNPYKTFRVGSQDFTIRYGSKIYELNEYVDEWCGFDENGEIVPVGTYFYIIYFNSTKETISSWIYVNY